jgi:hypothetical protein
MVQKAEVMRSFQQAVDLAINGESQAATGVDFGINNT